MVGLVGRRRVASRLARSIAVRRASPLAFAALALVAALATAFEATPARAGDVFEIQVYDGTANAPGALGLELHLNDWATGHRDAVAPEAPLHGQFHATLEPSLGLAPFWEVGAYLQGAVRPDDGAVDWAGAKLRSKFVTPEGFDPHWRLGMNLEVSYVPDVYERDRWGLELRPIVAWHSEAWLFAVNPILGQPLSGSDASSGPSLEPALKAARALGPVALGFEYYATLGPVGGLLPARDEEHYLFEAVDWLSAGPMEMNAAVGEGLTPASAGVVLKVILGYTFGEQPRPATATPRLASHAWRPRP